jgi:DNA-binding LytR/AlgR family response regulator
MLRETMVGLEGKLPPGQFVRISRSIMVQVSSIREIRPKSHGDYLVVMRGGSKLQGTRKYRIHWVRLLGQED